MSLSAARSTLKQITKLPSQPAEHHAILAQSCIIVLLLRPLEDMLIKLHSEAESSQLDSQLDADGTTATLHEATQQLRGQHLSGIAW